MDAADTFLALIGIEQPTEKQHAGALLLAEFVLRVSHALTKE